MTLRPLGPALVVAIVLLLTTPSVAQLDEAGTHFTLTTERTYGSGEIPRVRLWGQGFTKLQMRVYKVRDAVRFFRELEDPNQFGGQSHRPPAALTTLERFHQWKRQSRSWMRNVIRRQYSDETRPEIRRALLARESPPPKQSSSPEVTEYANVPVLNRQQLVAVWEQPFVVKQRWDAIQTPIEAAKDRGVYLVEATDGKLQAYTIVVVSDLVLMTRTTEGDILARVVDRKTGQPVPEVPVQGFLNRASVIDAKSDQLGFARITPPKTGSAEMPEGSERSLMLLAHRGPDVAPAPINEWQLRQGDPAKATTAYAWTDRPVYRPGHTVHWKIILRVPKSLGYELPKPGSSYQAVIEDPEGKTVWQKAVTPSANGTVSGELALAATGALGYYSLSLRNGEQWIGNAGFFVEEYRKPEYEVRVAPAASRVLQGDKVRATINARYYFGEPVPGAKVKYVVHRSRYWPPWYLDEDQEEASAEEQDEYSDNEQVLEEDGQLDANGALTVEIPTEKAKHDLRYRVEARVTDEAGREVSGTGFLLATRAAFYVHAEADKYVYAAGEDANIRVETRGYDGNAAGNLPFTIELKKKDRVVRTVSGRTDAAGNGSAAVRVDAGALHAEVTARDDGGRESSDTAYLWVSGSAGESWDFERQQRVEIVPDKKSYTAGETAKVLIVAGVPNVSVWVTAESRGVLMTRSVQAKGSTASFELPIQHGYEPNIWVTANFVHGGQLYSGMKSLRVPPVEQKLNVSVKPSKTQFLPGEKGVYTIEAKNSDGTPAPNAEFSVGVVDEAIYAIRREATQDIVSFFYGKRYLSGMTQTSLQYLFSGSSGKRRMQLTALRTDRRAQLKPEKFVDPRVRKAFPDTIRWIADVRTGASGRAEIPVEFPDSLTTWRTTVRGITPDTKVGSALDRTIVRKNMILRLTAPRFFVEGDEMTISAIVQNYLSTEKTVRVSLDVKGLELLDGGPRDVLVASRGTQQVQYRVRASSAGTATLTGKALTNEESDAMELEVPVNPYGVKRSVAFGSVMDSAAADGGTTLNLPADANASGRVVTITLSPSVAGAMFSALDYLVTFPYGCTEQTMSSFLPDVIVSQALKDLGVKGNIDQADLVRKTRAGLERLYSYQHDDGGWGWWHTDDSQTFMTAYVVAGLAQARTAGYDVKSEALDKAVTWLRSARKDGMTPDLRAYVAYAVSLASQAPDPDWVNSVWEKRNSLSPYGQALLGLALGADGRAAEVADQLVRSAKSSDTEVWWEMLNDPLLDLSESNSSSEATAFVLKFLTTRQPNSLLLAKAALYLMSHRDQGYYWSSTKQTAMVIFGLTDYLKASRELTPSYSATVTVNGKVLGTREFRSLEPWTLSVPAAQANTVDVTRSGSGRLYWSARADYYSTAEKQAAGGSDLAITREYFRLIPEKKGDRIVHRLEPLGDVPVARGEAIAVLLRVKGSKRWSYTMIEDPIPAGTEFVSRDDLYELSEKPKWWARWFSRREFHDDRMALFQQYFPGGETEQSYVLKVVNPGSFRVPPARITPMYQPGAFATSAAIKVEAR